MPPARRRGGRSGTYSYSSAPSRTRRGSPIPASALDDKGFVRTGAELGNGHAVLETSLPGVFAIGDVRAGSIKRVAAAVGEGAQVVATLHAYLAKATEDDTRIARYPEGLMADECTHIDADPQGDAERARAARSA